MITMMMMMMMRLCNRTGGEGVVSLGWEVGEVMVIKFELRQSWALGRPLTNLKVLHS